jgi:hypothetical protein
VRKKTEEVPVRAANKSERKKILKNKIKAKDSKKKLRKLSILLKSLKELRSKKILGKQLI